MDNIGSFQIRLRQARKSLGLNAMEMAAKVGLRDRKSWERYERGEASPKAEVLAFLSALGIDLVWLITGRAAQPKISSSINDELMGWVLVAVKAAYKEAHLGLPDMALGLVVSAVYREVSALDLGTLEEKKVAARAIATLLARQAVEANRKTDSSKRSA